MPTTCAHALPFLATAHLTNTACTGAHTITSGLEGAWTANPAQWDHAYFEYLFKYDWEQTKSPAGATQWVPKDKAAAKLVPDAHDPSKKHAPIMFTTDLALKMDPAYKVRVRCCISTTVVCQGGEREREASEAAAAIDRYICITPLFMSLSHYHNPFYSLPLFTLRIYHALGHFQEVSRRPKGLWRRFRQGLVQTHAPRFGPSKSPAGPICAPPQLWQDPLPPAPTSGSGAVGSLSASQLASLKSACLMAPGVSVASLVKCAWASASSYRATDRRGGANGARLLLAPQKVGNACVVNLIEGIAGLNESRPRHLDLSEVLSRLPYSLHRLFLQLQKYPPHFLLVDFCVILPLLSTL